MNKTQSSIVAGFGAMLAIGLLAHLDFGSESWVWLMAPFGASAVLVFGVPASPLAQPKNVIGGHLLTAAIGVLALVTLGINPWSLALASGLAVTAMLLTDTTHPPAGANPLLIMMTGQGWDFLITPVLIGAVLIVVLGQLQQRLLARQWQAS